MLRLRGALSCPVSAQGIAPFWVVCVSRSNNGAASSQANPWLDPPIQGCVFIFGYGSTCGFHERERFAQEI